MASTGMIIIMGIFLFLNIFSIKWKLENERHADAALDAAVLIGLGWVFGGTLTGLAIATVASGIMSLYLLISPPSTKWMEDL